jgi:predicted lipoprotein with Yx(FWY)xxD motif
MISSRRITALLLLVPVLIAGLIVGVGASTAKTKHKSKALQLRSTNLGRVLVDSKKHTLYMLTADSKNKSSCSAACAANWPPAKAPKKPKLGAGLKKGKLKVITRSDGSHQLAYAGHPLYRFIGDSQAGDTNGEGVNAFGGMWYVLNKSGTAVTKAAAPPPAPPSSGYGY